MITAETPRDYLPGEYNKLEHAFRRINAQNKKQDVYILRIGKFYGFSAKELDFLFNSLIISLFKFGAEVWRCAAHNE